MKRKEFLSSTCKLGICSCFGMPLLSSEVFAADDEKKKDDWRIGFMQKRFARLWEVVKNTVENEAEREKIIEGLGIECAKESSGHYNKYIGNVEGLLEDMKRSWIESTEYDKEKGIIKTVGKKSGKCGCPFVDNSQITKEFCNCSIGYQKGVWGLITGKKIEAKLVESVLYGAERCSFEIKIG